eukprot:gene31148-39094_t
MASYVGRNVKKHFEGHGEFTGTVVAFDAKDHKFPYLIRYADGDQEDVSENELLKCLLDSACGSTEEDKERTLGTKRKISGIFKNTGRKQADKPKKAKKVCGDQKASQAFDLKRSATFEVEKDTKDTTEGQAEASHDAEPKLVATHNAVVAVVPESDSLVEPASAFDSEEQMDEQQDEKEEGDVDYVAECTEQEEQ